LRIDCFAATDRQQAAVANERPPTIDKFTAAVDRVSTSETHQQEDRDMPLCHVGCGNDGRMVRLSGMGCGHNTALDVGFGQGLPDSARLNWTQILASTDCR
jgi:hypothetical protein